MNDDEPIGFALEHMDQARPQQIARYGIKTNPERIVLIRAELSDPLDKQTGAQLYDVSWLTVKMPTKEDIQAKLTGSMGDTDSASSAWEEAKREAQEDKDGDDMELQPMMMMPMMMQPKMTEVPLSEVAEATGQKSMEALYDVTKNKDDPPYEKAVLLRGLSAAEVHQLFQMSLLWAQKRVILDEFLTATHNTDITMKMGVAYRSDANDNNPAAHNTPKEA